MFYEAFHVEFYIIIKPIKEQNNIPTLYMLEIDSSVVKHLFLPF